MSRRGSNLLLTGRPGVGKTTLVPRVAERLPDHFLRGLVTREIRSDRSRREGFRIETLDGFQATLARRHAPSAHRVGSYGVDVGAVDAAVERVLSVSGTITLVDEIGPMECYSRRFRQAIRRILDGPEVLVATIHRSDRGFVHEVKQRADVEIWTIIEASRDGQVNETVDWIRAQVR